MQGASQSQKLNLNARLQKLIEIVWQQSFHGKDPDMNTKPKVKSY
jgi:hypothetical protein